MKYLNIKTAILLMMTSAIIGILSEDFKPFSYAIIATVHSLFLHKEIVLKSDKKCKK